MRFLDTIKSFFRPDPSPRSKNKYQSKRYQPEQYKKTKADKSLLIQKTRLGKKEYKRFSAEKTSSKKWDLSIFNKIFDFRFGHDRRLFITFSILIVIGIISVYSSSIFFADTFTGDKFYFLKNHLRFLFIGSFLLAIGYFVRVEIFVKFWFVPLITSIVLLILTLILAKIGANESVDGATRWISLGSVRLQPSDFAKLSFVIFVAAFLSRKRTLYRDFKDYFYTHFVPFTFWFLIIIVLILAGKNLGTALVVGFIGLTTYGIAATSKYHRKGFLLLLALMGVGGAAFGLLEGYRMDRIDVFVNYLKTGDTLMQENVNGKIIESREYRSYQFDQNLITVATGGLTGVGIGESKGKFHLVKTSAGDDSIIVIISEELGFVITSIIFLIYLYLVNVCISIANTFADKPIYFYLMIGCSAWIGFQMFIHVGANIGLVPLTGQTLPFISLGGSSLISLMAAMGIILNVSKQERVNTSAVRTIQR